MDIEREREREGRGLENRFPKSRIVLRLFFRRMLGIYPGKILVGETLNVTVYSIVISVCKIN